LAVQVLVGFVFINMTTFGGHYIAPLLPMLRFDYPGLPGETVGEQRVCNIGIHYRALTTFWPLALLIISITVLLLVCLLVGRALCSWGCPIGLIHDLITKTRSRLGIKPRELKQKTHDRLAMAKYAVLMLTILLAASIGLTFFASETAGNTYKEAYPAGTSQIAPFCTVCPSPDIYYMGTVYNTGDWQFGSDPTRIVALFVIVIIIGAAIITPRFWCRYLCPMGALSSIFNKSSMIALKKDHSKCTKCNYCVTSCDMRVSKVLNENKDERVMDTNCTLCLECVDACPEKAVYATIGTKRVYQGKWSEWWKSHKKS
jgi:polyferredoxin